MDCMVYTEIKERNRKRYYYRVISLRKGEKISKLRTYLGVNLSKKELSLKEGEADKQLAMLYLDKKKKIIERIKRKIVGILRKHHIKKAGIFGSYALGEGKRGSDIDILIEAPKGIGFGFVRIQFELQDALKKKVDLVSYDSIHPRLRERILREEVRIL